MNNQSIGESVALSITPIYRELFNIKSLESEYVKSTDDALFDYNPFAIEHQQAYNPIYSSLFECDNEPDDNLQLLSFNRKYNFVNMNTIEELETKQYINKPVFIKFAPLLDPIKYMIGKYEKYGNDATYMPKYNQSTFAKIDNIHNSSYVDCFFSYLSSRLLHDYGIPHGIDFLGCNLGVQSKYKMNIYDDLEYLNNSSYFNSNKGKLFQVSDYEETQYLNNISRGHKERLALNETKHNITNISIIDLDDICEIGIDVEGVVGGDISSSSPEEIYQKSQSLKTVSSSDTSNNSELNYSTDDDEDEDDSTEYSTVDEDDDDAEDDDNADENDDAEENDNNDAEDEDNDNADDEDNDIEPTVFAYINNFPVQMICLEKCEGTLDELFTKKKIDIHTSASAMFQIVMTLLIYQRAFQFTHNDLHTNNIMYVSTEEEYLYYEFNGKKYKVPTYGKIFKLIDFGRSIKIR
jgi:hypothetical protein